MSPWGGSGESESGTEKTDENWSLRRLAFSKGDEIIFSAETRSGIPIFSVLFLLMYDQSFLVHPSSETKFPTYCEYAFLHSRWHSLLTSRYLFLTLSDWECLNLAYHLCFFLNRRLVVVVIQGWWFRVEVNFDGICLSKISKRSFL